MPSIPISDLHASLSRQGAAGSHHRRVDDIRSLCESSPHCLAIALVGSIAQGTGDRISDLDLAAFVADDREAEFLQQVDVRLSNAEVLDAYGHIRPGQVAFRKYVFMDFSSCEFHAFNHRSPFRLMRPYIPLWDPHDYLQRLVVSGEPPRHETFEPYPHGDDGLIWELVDCVKWLRRGRTGLAKRYLANLGKALGGSDGAA
jgi:hypothetical protein